MNKRVILSAAAIAVLLVISVAIAYRVMFGTSPTESQTLWGQFGDFFGGVLNPLFAMLAFLALLWSMFLQKEEAQSQSDRLLEQSKLAHKQLDDLTKDRLNQELLHVIKELDARLSKLIETSVSPPGSPRVVTVAMMVAEAERLATYGGVSAAYSEFIAQSRTAGSVIEASVREIGLLVEEMRAFLEQLSRFRSGSYAPVIVYYANKAYRLLHMLEDIGCIPSDTRAFFATVSDPHN